MLEKLVNTINTYELTFDEMTLFRALGQKASARPYYCSNASISAYFD